MVAQRQRKTVDPLYHVLKVSHFMSTPNDIAGIASLTICESLLLALSDHKVLPKHEIVGILQDAAASHEDLPTVDDGIPHESVAELIRGMIIGGNSVRHR